MRTSLIDAITLNRQNVEIYTRAYHPCRLLPHWKEDDAFQTPHKLCVPAGSVRSPPEACVLLIQRGIYIYNNCIDTNHNVHMYCQWLPEKAEAYRAGCPEMLLAIWLRDRQARPVSFQAMHFTEWISLYQIINFLMDCIRLYAISSGISLIMSSNIYTL